MPSALPTDNALYKALDTYGIGTYDDLSDDTDKGEDSEESSMGPALPGTPNDIPPNEPYLGYPTMETPQGKHATGFSQFLFHNPILAKFILRADSVLPNDGSINPRGALNPNAKTKGGVLNGTDVVNTVSQHSELPDDGDNPSARSDYYDDMQTGGADLTTIDNIWPKEDSGAYVSGEESLPVPNSNTKYEDNYTSPMGNSDSGFVIEDQQVPRGFPSTEFTETVDYGKSNDETSIPGGQAVATGSTMKRIATDIAFVEELTTAFLKEHGKKDITRRAVTAFLQSTGHGDRQYIASDIMRCLKHNHNIVIPDVLDMFPVRMASGRMALAAIRDALFDLEFASLDDEPTARELNLCSSHISRVIQLLDSVSESSI